MRRTFDGTKLTEIANRVEVRPLLGGKGQLDLVPMVGDINNFVFVDDALEGGEILTPLFRGLYEVHTIMAAGVSPRAVCRFLKNAAIYMFTATDCVEVVTKTYHDNQGAIWLCDQMKFELDWSGEATDYRKLSLDKWVRSCSTVLERGQRFHGDMETAKREAGSVSPVHPDDVYHNRVVGAAVMMIEQGNVVKGLDFYNRWAVFYGYVPIRLLSLQPVIVDISDAILGLVDGRMEML